MYDPAKPGKQSPDEFSAVMKQKSSKTETKTENQNRNKRLKE